MKPRKPITRTMLLLVAVALLAMTAAKTMADDEIRRTDLRVERLSCSSCLVRIEMQLQTLDGFLGMEADLRQGEVRVDHEPGVTAATIVAAINDLGYPTTILSTENIPREQAGAAGHFNCGSGGCGVSSPCNANAAAWKELFNRWFNRLPGQANNQ